eukprot:501522_1
MQSFSLLIVFLFINSININCVLCQYLSYFWNETYTMPGIYEVTKQTRIYHIAYWNSFQLNDPTYKYPVIYALHGGGGSARGHVRQTGLHIQANAMGFLVVYPEGMAALGSNTSRTWNAGNCCGGAANWNSKDSQFLLDILNDIEHTQNVLNIDRNRVFFTGHSNGAKMSWRMACEYPYNVTGIAPNAGAPGFKDAVDCDMLCDISKPNITDKTCWNSSALNDDCSINNWYKNLPSTYECIMSSNTRTVPVLGLFGYDDEHVLWNGGAGHDFISTTQNNDRPTPPFLYIAQWTAMIAGCDDYNRDISEIETLLYESHVNGINTDSMISYYNATGISDSSTCISYSGCDNPVTFCTAWNGGHTWNGGHYSFAECDSDDPDYAPIACGILTKLVGDIAFSLNNNRMMFEFFDGLTLKESEMQNRTESPSISPSDSSIEDIPSMSPTSGDGTDGTLMLSVGLNVSIILIHIYAVNFK